MILEIIIPILVVLAVGIPIFFLIRSIKNKQKENDAQYNLETKYGTKVMLSAQTKNITKEMFEEWTNDLIVFWNDVKGWSKEECYKRIGNTKIKIFDENKITRAGKEVNGLAWLTDYLIEMSSFPPNTKTASIARIKSLFRHEESHFICYYIGNIDPGPNSGETHHELFKEVKLGA